jgi:hypothetical protein
MNLHGIVRGAIRTINPEVKLQIQVSTGQTVTPGGKQVPQYASPILHWGQVQPLSQKDLQLVESLNLQGTLRAIYMNGNVDGEVRVEMKGGDLITVMSGPNAGVYLVSQVAEAWDDWSHSVCVLQNGS